MLYCALLKDVWCRCSICRWRACSEKVGWLRSEDRRHRSDMKTAITKHYIRTARKNNTSFWQGHPRPIPRNESYRNQPSWVSSNTAQREDLLREIRPLVGPSNKRKLSRTLPFPSPSIISILFHVRGHSSVDCLLYLRVYMDHILIQFRVLAHHNFRVPGCCHKDRLDSAL